METDDAFEKRNMSEDSKHHAIKRYFLEHLQEPQMIQGARSVFNGASEYDFPSMRALTAKYSNHNG